MKHIVLTERLSGDELYSFSMYALENDMTINYFYFAHSLRTSVYERNLNNYLSNLSEDCIYIFSEDVSLKDLDYNLSYYQVDGYIVGIME